MRALDRMQVRDALLDRIRADVPFLGICLGLQALFESSEEAPEERGLGCFEAKSSAFRPRRACRTWDGTRLSRSLKRREAAGELEAASLSLFRSQLLCARELMPQPPRASTTLPYTAVLETKNIFGVQFHPEKSGPLGLKIVRNFVEL